MKKRIKDIPIPSNEFCNDFCFKYRRCIEYFAGERKEESVFTPDGELEQNISALIFDDESRVIYFLGESGIGKTMLLKNIFCASDNGVVFDDDKSMVVLSINFRGVLVASDIESFLVNSIAGVCTALEERFGFSEKFYSDSGHMEFYDYVKETKRSLLEYVNAVELIGKNELEARKYRLQKAQEHNPYTYLASRLKFYMNCYCERIKKLTIVMDNVEALPSDMQPEQIRDALALFSCMLNVFMSGQSKSVKVKLLLSMRDVTFERLCENEVVNAYAPYSIIYKKTPVDMGEFFKKRMDRVRINEEEAQTWNEAYEILLNLTYKFDEKYSLMIQNLCNYDFQLMKKCYKKILTNKVWLLRGERRNDFLNMSKTDYMFNNISVLRSIACGNNEVYRREKSVIVPNVLLNDEFGDDSMVSLLVLSFFDRSGAVVKKSKLIRTFKQIFADKREIISSLYRVVGHFLDCKILNQIKYIREYTEKGEYLEITPRGQEIWKMFASDSVLLEMYREDHYFVDRTEACNFISSRQLMATMGQCEIFLQLFRFIGELLKLEKDLHKKAIENGMLSEYQSCFGAKAQTKRLLEGVVKSIEYSGNAYNSDICDEKIKLETEIKNIDEI